jgi:hypothetical protein
LNVILVGASRNQKVKVRALCALPLVPPVISRGAP